MILLFCIYFIIAIVPAFCHDRDILEIDNIKITNDEDFTIIDCNKHELQYIALPPKKLFNVKDDMRFRNCRILNNFNISKLMDNLRIKVTKLSFESCGPHKYNLDSLESLKHFQYLWR